MAPRHSTIRTRGLQSLKTACLNGNALQTLPDSFGDLAALKMLNLERAKVGDAPRLFGDLPLAVKPKA